MISIVLIVRPWHRLPTAYVEDLTAEAADMRTTLTLRRVQITPDQPPPARIGADLREQRPAGVHESIMEPRHRPDSPRTVFVVLLTYPSSHSRSV
jgi:hypothetical protein